MVFERFFLFLVLFVYQKAMCYDIADASLWLHQKYAGKSCEDLNQNDVLSIDHVIDSNSRNCKSTIQNLKSIQSLNDIAETVFFEHSAKNVLKEINCEITSVNLFEKDESLIKIRAEEIAEKLPLIKEQTEHVNRAYFGYSQIVDRNNVFAAICRNSSAETRKQCFNELKIKRDLESAHQVQWHKSQSLLNAILGSLWNGDSKTIKSFIAKLLKYDPQPSNELIFQALKKQIPKFKTELNENRSELVKQSVGPIDEIKFSNLDDETKRKLVEDATSHGGFLTLAANEKDDAAIKLMCRLEGKYSKGRDSLNRTIGTATFLIGGIGGIVSKVPIALRAGQLNNFFGRFKSSSTLLAAVASGADFGVAAYAVAKKCFSSDLQLISKNSCPTNSDELKAAELVNLRRNNCILSAALSVAPAGLLATSKAVTILKSKIDSSKFQIKNSQVNLPQGAFLSSAVKQPIDFKKVQSYEKELEELLKADLNSNVCFGASDSLRELLFKKSGIKAEMVGTSVNNWEHYLLVVRDHYGKGRHLYIDPTLQQFASK